MQKERHHQIAYNHLIEPQNYFVANQNSEAADNLTTNSNLFEEHAKKLIQVVSHFELDKVGDEKTFI